MIPRGFLPEQAFTCREGGPHRTDTLGNAPCTTCGRKPPEDRVYVPWVPSFRHSWATRTTPPVSQYDPRRLASGDDDEA
jgi:hypothetical protein